MRFRVLRWIRSDVATGNKQYREVVVQTRRLTIGRGSDQHLQIADPKVFENHAVIRPGRGREGAMVVEALTPSGVIVNGRNRLSSSLNPGDEVRIGPAVLIVEPGAEGRAPFTLRFRMAEQENGRLDRLRAVAQRLRFEQTVLVADASLGRRGHFSSGAYGRGVVPAVATPLLRASAMRYQ